MDAYWNNDIHGFGKNPCEFTEFSGNENGVSLKCGDSGKAGDQDGFSLSIPPKTFQTHLNDKEKRTLDWMRDARKICRRLMVRIDF